MSISKKEEDPQEVWSRYFAVTESLPAHAIFDSLEPYLPPSGKAIDLGCGGGRGTLRLLDHGLDVVAVDVSEEALSYLRPKIPAASNVELICSSFTDLDLDSYDVVVACFTLFFMPPAEFDAFWPRVVSSMKPSGIFAGQFLGVNDSWNERGFTVHDREGVDELLSDLDVLMLKEEERDGETALGEPKHWHVFHVIARRPK